MSDRQLPLEPFGVSPTLGKQQVCPTPVTDEKDRDVLVKLIDGTQQSTVMASRARDTIAFQYLAAISAFAVGIASGRLSQDDVLGRIILTAVPLILATVGSYSIQLRSKQHKKLLRALVHKENLLGSFSEGAYVKGTTLSPTDWLDVDDWNSVGLHRPHFVALWLTAAIGVLATWIL